MKFLWRILKCYHFEFWNIKLLNYCWLMCIPLGNSFTKFHSHLKITFKNNSFAFIIYQFCKNYIGLWRDWQKTKLDRIMILSSTYLKKDINLRLGIEFSLDRCCESLPQMYRHFLRLAITPRSALPFPGAERGHTVLTVDQNCIVDCLLSPTPNL